MKYILLTLFLISCISNIVCLKLLLVFPVASRSHYFLGRELGKGLAKAGHEVTIVTCYSERNPVKNFKEIILPELVLTREKQFGNHNFFDVANAPAIFRIPFINIISNMMTTDFLEHPKTQELLKSEEHFDAVVMEQFFSEAWKIFAYHFKAHLILFSPVGSNSKVNYLVANPEPSSYVPDVFLGFSGNMNFYERTYNFLYGLISDLNLHLYLYRQQNDILKKYYPNAPDLNKLQYNVSLVLTNSHESVNQPVPHVPNIIDIGGFHVNPPGDLPKDLKEFMDTAKEGVIYFSMGSSVIPSQMPKEKKYSIIKTFGARREKVLWKWNEDTLENKPDNVMISKWFPQQAILAHPNCRLFITHGGLLSTIETVYFGVPILSIPVFGDQQLNAARAVSLGYGKSLQMSELNENNFAEAVNELLENSSYRENAKLRSRIMHDRPIKPMDLATYWIEYVVRHKGAHHLRVAGINLPFYKYYLLDVIGALLAGLALVIYLNVKCGRYICLKIFKSKDSKLKLESRKKRE